MAGIFEIVPHESQTNPDAHNVPAVLLTSVVYAISVGEITTNVGIDVLTARLERDLTGDETTDLTTMLGLLNAAANDDVKRLRASHWVDMLSLWQETAATVPEAKIRSLMGL